MRPVRKWGHGPFAVAVIHGGPGAPGEMAPVARELSNITGILEPFQSEITVDGQVEELRLVLQEHAAGPVTLIGFSWGAFLSWLFAARYPELVKKLILVSSPPFEEQYASAITQTRMARLPKNERVAVQEILAHLNDDTFPDRDLLLADLGTLLTRADAYDAATAEDAGFPCRYDVFRGVWDEAARLRKEGVILRLAEKIACPVIAIHGDTDPHPARGVNDPLSQVLPNFRFILLEKCGHRPWTERYAAEEFFRVLAHEI